MSSICITSNAGILYHIFDDYSGLYSIASAQSPARVTGNSTQELYVGVISKKNQPRNVGALGGTNPHQGTDFLMSYSDDFYAMLPGVVSSIRYDPNNDQLGYVIIKSTINNQDYYMKYLHIVPDSQLDVNQQVFSDTVLGQVQYPYAYPPAHVHVSCSTYSNMSITTELFPFFRHNSQYNFGADMDLICGEDFDDNFLYIYAYIRSDTTTVPSGLRIDCEKVRLYYNINDSGWKSDNYVDYDVNDYYIPAIFKYQLNLYETGLHCGDTIKLYLVAFRSNSNSADNTFYNSSSMNFGVSPMYYLQPDEYLGTNAQYYEYTLNQTHDWTTWSVTTQPTCATKGTESRTCYNCDAEETRDYGSALGHNYNDATCELPATCQRQGCSATCGSALGHNYNDATCELPATCQRQGCSATYGSALGHNYNDATCELPATCTRQGCSATYSSALYHDYSDATCESPATCQRPGCGATYGSPLDHDMSAWSVTTPATCCSPGDKVRYCMRTGCSHSEDDTIPENPSNHAGGSYWTVTTAATCTSSGIRSQICYGCSAVLSTQPIAALGHSWGSWIYQYQYYDEDLQYYVRVYKRTCSKCGIYEYDYLD